MQIMDKLLLSLFDCQIIKSIIHFNNSGYGILPTKTGSRIFYYQ